MWTRHTSKLIDVINDDSDKNSEQVTEEGSISEKDINPINTKHWKIPSKFYYQRPTAPDNLLFQFPSAFFFSSYSLNTFLHTPCSLCFIYIVFVEIFSFYLGMGIWFLCRLVQLLLVNGNVGVLVFGLFDPFAEPVEIVKVT